MEREVEEQVEDELGRFLLSLVQGEDGPVSLLQGEEGPGDGVVVISTSKDLRFWSPVLFWLKSAGSEGTTGVEESEDGK